MDEFYDIVKMETTHYLSDYDDREEFPITKESLLRVMEEAYNLGRRASQRENY